MADDLRFAYFTDTQVLTDFPNAHSILADAGSRHVLAPTLGNDRVNQLTFDTAKGMLAPNTPPSVGVKDKAGPRPQIRDPVGPMSFSGDRHDASPEPVSTGMGKEFSQRGHLGESWGHLRGERSDSNLGSRDLDPAFLYS